MNNIKDNVELIRAIISHEKKCIDKFLEEDFVLTHCPTIGDMYEGITRKFLDEGGMDSLNIRVVEGFIKGVNGTRSGQIDCMLVIGEGIKVPNTTSEVVEIENVIAVIEVKKTLYSAALEDTFLHFDELMKVEKDHSKDVRTNWESLYRNFSAITGVHLNSFEEAKKLPFATQAVFHSLVNEYTYPVRIVISYDGYKSEKGFRKGVVDIMKQKVGGSWISASNFPDLIISGNYSLVKMNGRPYTAKTDIENFGWLLYSTSPSDPIKILLEFIYTEISKYTDIVNFWGEDLNDEVINPFLSAFGRELDGEKNGWEFFEHDLSDFDEVVEDVPWEPFCFEDPVIEQTLMLLCNSEEPIAFKELVSMTKLPEEELTRKLKENPLISIGEDRIYLNSVSLMGVFSNGKLYFGENNTGRLTRWVMSQQSKLGS